MIIMKEAANPEIMFRDIPVGNVFKLKYDGKIYMKIYYDRKICVVVQKVDVNGNPTFEDGSCHHAIDLLNGLLVRFDKHSLVISYPQVTVVPGKPKGD